MLKIDIVLENGFFAYDTDFVKDNDRSIYTEGMYGDIYRVEKKSKKVYMNGKFIGMLKSMKEW